MKKVGAALKGHQTEEPPKDPGGHPRIRVDFAGILRRLHDSGYDEGFSFEVKLKYVEDCREKIDLIWIGD